MERLCDKSTDSCEKTTFPTSILRQMSSDDRSMAVPVNPTCVAWKPSWGGIDGLTFLAPAPTFPSSVAMFRGCSQYQSFFAGWGELYPPSVIGEDIRLSSS